MDLPLKRVIQHAKWERVRRTGCGLLQEPARKNVADARGHLDLCCNQVASLKVYLLADVSPGGAVDPSDHRNPGWCIKRVAGAGQPPIVVVRQKAELWSWLRFPAESNVVNVSPAHLIA